MNAAPAEVPTEAELQALARALGERLVARRAYFATAESCTGGLIAKIITDIPGSSRWFHGGIVSYSNQAKQYWLDVSVDTLEVHGAVSAAVVLEMASGLHRRVLPTLPAVAGQTPELWTLSASGIAGPDGGTADKPVGTVWIGWGGSGVSTSASRYVFKGSRDDVRRATAAAGLLGLMALLD